MSDTNGWSEYQLLVLAELQRHNVALEAMTREINDLKIQLASINRHGERIGRLESEQLSHGESIAGLRVRAGIWGASSGLLAAIGAGLLYLLKSM